MCHMILSMEKFQYGTMCVSNVVPRMEKIKTISNFINSRYVDTKGCILLNYHLRWSSCSGEFEGEFDARIKRFKIKCLSLGLETHVKMEILIWRCRLTAKSVKYEKRIELFFFAKWFVNIWRLHQQKVRILSEKLKNEQLIYLHAKTLEIRIILCYR